MKEATKQCSVCGEVKPLGEYYKAPNCRDGRRSMCKACYRAKYTGSVSPRRQAKGGAPMREMILIHRIGTGKPMSLQAIGDRFGVTRQHVYQTEKRLRSKLGVAK